MMLEPLPYALVIATPLPGALRLGVVVALQQVTCIDFLPDSYPLQHAHDDHARRIEQQLLHYFHAPTQPLTVSLRPQGTAYQQRVWRALQQIPAGTVVRYGELAQSLGSGARAVAAACRANPIPLLIPCHRVVAKSGLGGYMGVTEGSSLALKEWLLGHENAL